jgi:branched-chain amino acid transport system ATP-binding protein
MLRVTDVHTYYDESHILHGMSLELRDGEVATLIGRNGAGKTTTLRSIMGIVRPQRGSITLDDCELTTLASDLIAKRGIAYVPEERGIFSTLNVRENLLFAPVLAPSGWTVERIFDTFPNLKARASAVGTTLSGGEQQMLAIARALRSGARTILLDEPTEGLAPIIVERIGEIVREMKAAGISVLLVEQNVRFAAAVADRHHIVVHGRVEQVLDTADLVARENDLLAFLGV